MKYFKILAISTTSFLLGMLVGACLSSDDDSLDSTQTSEEDESEEDVELWDDEE